MWKECKYQEIFIIIWMRATQVCEMLGKCRFPEYSFRFLMLLNKKKCVLQMRAFLSWYRTKIGQTIQMPFRASLKEIRAAVLNNSSPIASIIHKNCWVHYKSSSRLRKIPMHGDGFVESKQAYSTTQISHIS